MPTLIDELVVRLSLDPRQFDAGTRAIIASLQRMQAAAQNSGAQVSAIGQAAVNMHNAIRNPIATLHSLFTTMATVVNQPHAALQNLTRQGVATGAALTAAATTPQAALRNLAAQGQATGAALATATAPPQAALQNLATQGHVTGAAVSRGMSAATTSVRAFGIAGLAAFAAYEALNKAFRAAGAEAGKVMGTGINARAAGMGINEFGAVAQALFVGGNVPQEETQNWLAQYQEMQGQASVGMDPGIGFITNLNKNLAQAQVLGGGVQFGIDPFHDTPEEMATKLARGLAQMPEAQAYSAGNALGLSRQMVYGLRTEGERLPADIAHRRATAPTSDDERSAQRLIQAENQLATAWEKLYRDIMLSGLADTLTRFANWLDAFIEPVQPGDTRNWWERHAPSVLGGKEAPTTVPGSAPRNNPGNIRAPGGGFMQYDTYEQGVEAMRSNLLGYEERHGINTLGGIISRWSPPNENPTAQLIENASRRSALAPNQVIDLHDPETMQRVVNAIIVQEQGSALPKSAAAAGRQPQSPQSGQEQSGQGQSTQSEDRILQPLQALPALQTATGGTQSTMPAWYDSSNWPAWLNTITGGQTHEQRQEHHESTTNRMRTIQHSHATTHTATTHNHNHGDVNLHGDIVVHAPSSREGHAIARSVSDQVRQLTPKAVSSNTGLE